MKSNRKNLGDGPFLTWGMDPYVQMGFREGWVGLCQHSESQCSEGKPFGDPSSS